MLPCRFPIKSILVFLPPFISSQFRLDLAPQRVSPLILPHRFVTTNSSLLYSSAPISIILVAVSRISRNSLTFRRSNQPSLSIGHRLSILSRFLRSIMVMAAASSISANLSLTLAHAISFLTRPLIPLYPATAIIKLRSVLDANLTAHYAPLWAAGEPPHNSTRRCITLSPDRLPPSIIYSACLTAGVQWFDWISLLGGREFDLFVEPGRVSVQSGRNYTHEKQLTTVWADHPTSPPLPVEPSVHRTIQMPMSRSRPQTKTLAQQLLEVDHEDDERLFTLIADEVSSPTWITSIQQRSPPIRSPSPLSTSAHSRSSSRSSNSSSCFSLVSRVSSGSVTSLSTSPSPAFSSRCETARPTRVFVDTSKTEVTPYDGGKTTVLTGGVMLGGASGTSKPMRSRPVMKPANYSHSVRP